MGTVSIPLGATVHVRRLDGSTESFVFRGSDGGGLIFEDSAGVVHRDLGIYIEITIRHPDTV